MNTQALYSLLMGYSPHNDLEEGYLRRMLKLCGNESPWKRSNFDPGHFTASAFVVSANREDLLLILHNKLNKWLQPGGHIDATDEDSHAAATREVMEETGLRADDLHSIHDGIFDIDIHTIPAHGDEPEHDHFDLRFLFAARDEDALLNKCDDEVAEIRWCANSSVREVTDDASVLRVVLKLRHISHLFTNKSESPKA